MNEYDPNYVPDHAKFILGVKVLVVNKNGKILILKRSNKVSRPQGWDFPGGGVDRGETPENAALREIKEETGLRVDQLQLMSTYLSSTDGEDDLIIGYVGIINDEPTVQLTGWEHDDFKWITIDELKSIKLPKEHAAIVELHTRKS